MRWKGRRQSDNVEDRRQMTPRKMGLGGGAGLLLLVGIYLCMGGDPLALLQVAVENPPPVRQGPAAATPQEEELAEFVGVVLADTEDVWHELFRENGNIYQEPRLVLYRERVQSACGFNTAATGPFYCPGDAHVYLDLSFFDQMARQLNAPGDFAQAYVIAHEVGHHVQKLLGISDQVHAMQQRLGEEAGNELSVRLELQADYFAGVWAHHADQNWHILEPGDVDEALRAATAIGDDRLQQQAQGYVVPESFTHGTSEQRARWFNRGLETGDMSQGDTFVIEYDNL